MKFIYKMIWLLAVMLVVGCSNREKFHIEGEITDAADTVLYLEHLSLGQGIVPVDSIRLDAKGHFSFSADTVGNPEFYRLRIGEQCINLAIDSTETVGVKASLKNMSFGYRIEGSGTNDTIRLLTLKLADLEREVTKTADNNNYTIEERNQMIDQLIHDYKNEVKMDIIQNNYGAAYSYFACFQMLGGQLLFNPITDKSDLTWLRAVANAWNDKYPGCQRAQNIFNIVKEGRRNQVKPKQIVLDVDSSKVSELGIIDMTFPDIKGHGRTLSSLRGKVVLLDITAHALQGSHERTMELRELYNKYHSRGFEIYQVSVDPDYSFWTQRSEQLPWVSVYCAEGLDNDILQLYQVQTIPTYFLIDRNCDLQARQENIPDLRRAIEKLL